MSLLRHRAPALLVAAIALVAVGCSGSSSGTKSKSAPAIAADAKNAAAAAHSVHVSGTAAAQGQAVPVDLHVATNGSTGTVTFGGAQVQIVATGGNLYVRGAQKVLGQFLGSGAEKKIDDHWVQLSTSMPQLAQFAGLVSLPTLVNQYLTPTTTPTKQAVSTVGGQKVVALSGYGADGKGLLSVAASGTAYPVQLQTSVGKVTFADWNAPVTVTVPTDVVPLASLTG